MSDVTKLFVEDGLKVLEAINVINKTEAHIALVVDKEKKLLGTITDGDIRRGLLKGFTTESNIKKFMNIDFKAIYEEEIEEINSKKFFDEDIKYIPLIDKSGHVKDILKREEIARNNKKIIKTAVIMAGGKGTRLKPHTSNCPKPMLKIKGKPMLEIILNRCINSGFSCFYFSVNYLKEQIIDYFEDGNKWGVNINYLIERKPLGTAGALKLVPQRLKDPLLVLNGDVITDLDLNSLVNFHQQYSAAITVAAKYEENLVPYGVIHTSGIELLEIVEKPIQKILVSAGVYVINPEIIKFIDSDEHIDMPNLINKAKENNFKVLTFPIYEYWQDVGRPETLKIVSNEIESI